MMPNLTSFVVNIPSLLKKLLSKMDKGFYNLFIHYIRHMWNATSKSNVEPKLNFWLFQLQIRQSRI